MTQFPNVPPSRRASAGLGAAVRDALSRRQRELPHAFLTDPAIGDVRREVERRLAIRWQEVEGPLIQRWLHGTGSQRDVRRVVELLPRGACGTLPLLQVAADRSPALTYIAVDPSAERAHEATSRVSDACPEVAVHALDADPALMLPLRQAAGTVLAIMAGGLGTLTPVSAVRTLRSVRAAMSLDDTLLLSLDQRRPEARLADLGAPRELLTQWHRHALHVANRDAGADFEVERFTYAARFEPEHRRLEEGVAAVAACRVQVPGMDPLSLRSGELVRTAVQCCYERTMLQSMLRGVGLSVDEWLDADDGSGALAVARIRFPDDGQP